MTKPLTNKGFDQIPVRGLRKNLKELSYLTFGHSDFRTGQFEIISASLTSYATLGLLPTGGGKSLCFQLPGAIFPGCTVVVCPITALVRDHFLELSEFGFEVSSVPSSTFKLQPTVSSPSTMTTTPNHSNGQQIQTKSLQQEIVGSKRWNQSTSMLRWQVESSECCYSYFQTYAGYSNPANLNFIH